MAHETNILVRLGNLIDNIIERMRLLEERVTNVEKWNEQISEDIISAQKNNCYQPIIDDLNENDPPKGNNE